jgi:hypothetical protein
MYLKAIRRPPRHCRVLSLSCQPDWVYDRDNDGYYDDSYAYDDGYAANYWSSNGFVCQPGTWFRGEDGYRHLCQ